MRRNTLPQTKEELIKYLMEKMDEMRVKLINLEWKVYLLETKLKK